MITAKEVKTMQEMNDEEIKEFTRKTDKELSRILTLISDMLDLSRLETQREVKTENINLVEVAEEVKSSLSGLAESKNISVTVSGKGRINAEKEHALELVKNLVENSIRYGNDGGYVKVNVAETDDKTVLTVEDNGVGIEEKHQTRIFERFYRVNKSRSRESGGTAAYSKWDVNTRYTYLFKISQNTNGYTGDDPNKAGLYPITFDALVKESTDAMQGTVTTVTTPSITTYQAGSVTDNGIEYKSGTAIDVTVTDANGNVQTLTTGGTTVGNVAAYKFTDAINEAEIQVKGTTSATAVTGEVTGNMFTFTPATEGYYAIQYLTTAATAKTPAAYAYKVVYVKAAPRTTE